MDKVKFLTHWINHTPENSWDEWIAQADFDETDLVSFLKNQDLNPLIEHIIKTPIQNKVWAKLSANKLLLLLIDDYCTPNNNIHEPTINLLIKEKDSFSLSCFGNKKNLENSKSDFLLKAFNQIINQNKYNPKDFQNSVYSLINENQKFSWQLIKCLDERKLLTNEIVHHSITNFYEQKMGNMYHTHQDRKEIKFQKLDEIYPTQGFWNNVYYLIRKSDYPIENFINNYLNNFSIAYEKKILKIFKSEAQIHITMQKICQHEADKIILSKINNPEEFALIFPSVYLKLNNGDLPHIEGFMTKAKELTENFNDMKRNPASLSKLQQGFKDFFNHAVPNNWHHIKNKINFVKNMAIFYNMDSSYGLNYAFFQKATPNTLDPKEEALYTCLVAEFPNLVNIKEFFNYFNGTKAEKIDAFLLSMMTKNSMVNKPKIL